MAEGSLLKSVTIKRGKDSPSTMCRGAAAAGGGKCYFMSAGDSNIHVYDVEKDDWFAARQALCTSTSLAVIDGQLTTVGGEMQGETPRSRREPTNLLHTLANRRWQTKYPAMVVDTALGIDNRKCGMPVVQTGTSLIVIGGGQDDAAKHVNILDTATSTWTRVHDLPNMFYSSGTATVAGDEIYALSNGSAYQCFLDELKDDSKPAGSVWTAIAKPTKLSDDPTLGSLCGQAVAIGGNKNSRSIYAYDPDKNSWYEIGQMAIGRSQPLVAQLAEDKIVVAGGISGSCGMGNDVVVTEIITGVV